MSPLGAILLVVVMVLLLGGGGLGLRTGSWSGAHVWSGGLGLVLLVVLLAALLR